MKRCHIKAVLLAGGFFISGCGGHSMVRIPYFLPEGPNPLETRKALSNVYIAIKITEEGNKNIFSKALEKIAGPLNNDLNGMGLAMRIIKNISQPDVNVVAASVLKGTSDSKQPGGPFIDKFNPSCLMEVNVTPPEALSSEDVAYKAGMERKVFIYESSMNMEVRLLRYPDMHVLDKWSEKIIYKQERESADIDNWEWYTLNEERFFNVAASKIVARYIGHQVERRRPVLTTKGDKEMEEAAKLVEGGEIEKGEEIWRGKTASGDWRAYLGLGVASELKKDFKSSLEFYKTAREKGVADKESGIVNWQEIFNDLYVMMFSASAARNESCEWFKHKIAVLPFANETTSLDGPVMIRQMFYNALGNLGYNVLSLEETDAIIRKHGMTDGGQINAFKKEDLCKWLGVKRILFANIIDFNETITGVYNKRRVKGAAFMWDLNTKSEIWKSDESFEGTKIASLKNAGESFGLQLFRGILERMQNKLLAHESYIFVRKTLETLPMNLKHAER